MAIIATDRFPNDPLSVTTPLTRGATVTPSNTDELVFVTRAIYVGATGDLVVVMKDGSEVTLVGLAAGVFHPLRVRQVKTSSTATGIRGFD